MNLGERNDGAAIVDKALDNGLLLNAPTSDALRFMPALNMHQTEIAEMLAILDGVLARG